MEYFEEKILDQIRSNGLFDKIDRVLLAVSGGADSVAMAHVLVGLKRRGVLSSEFVIGHVNHCLRGDESDADEAFVRKLADSFAIPVITKTVDVKAYAQEHKLSIETAGRTLRLNTLAAITDEHGCDCIATAHHKDDLAETMIHRLMRGTGFRGLCGIWPQSQVYDAQFIRPMLNVRRYEIIQYCKDNQITWREDASNCNINFTRNKIRHHLLPVLQGQSGDIVDRLSRLSYQSRGFLLWAEKHAKTILEKGRLDKTKKAFILSQDVLRNCPPWVFYEVLREMLDTLGVGLRDYSRQHFDAMAQMVEQQNAKADYPGQVQIVAERNILSVQVKTDAAVLSPEPVTLRIGRAVQFGQWKVSSKLLSADNVGVKQFFKTKDPFVEWFDADKIVGDIEICGRKEGDRFYPIGTKGEKKVARFLIDAQLDKKIKKQVFIIADVEKILWVAPVRMSDQVKITPQTHHILEIQISELK